MQAQSRLRAGEPLGLSSTSTTTTTATTTTTTTTPPSGCCFRVNSVTFSDSNYCRVGRLLGGGSVMRTSPAVLVCVVVLLLSVHGVSSAHLVKEFVTAHKEAARSMEPNKDNGEQADSSGTFDVAAVLCEKYTEWSKWSSCSRKCEQTRVRRCKKPEDCGRSWVKEKRTCTRARGACVPLSYKVIGVQKRNRMIEELLYDLLYGQWTEWGPCTRSCRQKRQRQCKYHAVCVHSYIQEERRCQVVGSRCEHRYSLKPLGFGKDDTRTDSEDEVDNSDDSDGEDEEEDYDNDNDNEGGSDETSDSNSSSSSSSSEVVEEEKEEGGGGGGDKSESDNGAFDIVSEDDKKNMTSQTTKIFRKGGWRPKGDSRKKNRKLHRGGGGPKLGRDVTLAQKNCGIRPKATSGSYRVVGGQEVRKNSWPWQVAILTKQQEQYCGGTLIAPRWVLTAAHCVRKKGKRRRLVVRVGEHDIDAYDPTQEDIRPEKEFPHPDFDYHTITNDIALIKLKHPPSAFTSPGYACLPTVDFKPPRDQLCSIVGWGKLKNTHIYGSESLMEAKVPVVRHRKCQRVFAYDITDNQVCAGYKRGGIDSCAGDSGGPLLCSRSINGTDRYVLFGVTSYGEGCGRKGKYGIYTRVNSYLDWIEKTISENR